MTLTNKIIYSVVGAVVLAIAILGLVIGNNQPAQAQVAPEGGIVISQEALTTILGFIAQMNGFEEEDEELGAGSRFPNGISTDSTSPSAGQIRGTTFTTTGAATIGGAATLSSTLAVTGAATLSGETTFLEASEAVAADNTLTTAESNSTYYLSGALATTTLPAVATATSSVFRFVVSASATGDLHIASAEGDNLEGSLIVAGAVVDCDAVDRITFVSDGENLGDFVEVRSDGQKWFITQSNALTSAKLTCSEGL